MQMSYIAFATIWTSGFGITAGAHRLWSHRAYKAKWPLRLLLVFLFTIAGQVSYSYYFSFLFSYYNDLLQPSIASWLCKIYLLALRRGTLTPGRWTTGYTTSTARRTPTLTTPRGASSSLTSAGFSPRRIQTSWPGGGTSTCPISRLIPSSSGRGGEMEWKILLITETFAWSACWKIDLYKWLKIRIFGLL